MARFRPATSDDLTALIHLLADDELGQTREIVQYPPQERYVAAFDAIQRDANQMLIVADDNGIVIGCMQLSFIPGLSRNGMWRGQIESVRVARSMRGSGLGRAMFEWAIGLCRERGCGLVQLTTDKTRTNAQAFYRSLGFDASHEGMKLNL